ncbi:MAG TPA: thioesterase family protein [Candidatus Thermoplasmatota archaeon]|nr:thioesterase family protein [Candidatus Thermoplasmatota archaeon]
MPIGRFLKVLALGPRRPRMSPLEESVLTFRVWPGDLDENRHMNNGRYLTLMDLGRTDLIVRTGILKAMLQRKWMALLAGATMRYRRPLNLLDRFTLHTRLVAWDDRWFYLEQRFVKRGETAAIGWVRAAFRGPQGLVPTAELLAIVGHTDASPPLPEGLQHWLLVQDALGELERQPA